MQVPPWLLSVTACFYINKCIQLELRREGSPLLILPPPSGVAEPLRDSWEVRITDDLKKQHPLPLSHSHWLFSWTPKAKYIYLFKTELHGAEEVTVMFFYHMVGVEQGIYITPEEAFAQLFHRDTSSQLQHAVSGILPFFLPQFNLIDSQNQQFNSELQYWRLLVVAVIVVLTPLNETKYFLSKKWNWFQDSSWRVRVTHNRVKISGLLRI